VDSPTPAMPGCANSIVRPLSNDKDLQMAPSIPIFKSPSRPGPSSKGVNSNKRQRDIPNYFVKDTLNSLKRQVDSLHESILPLSRGTFKRVNNFKSVRIRDPPVSPKIDPVLPQSNDGNSSDNSDQILTMDKKDRPANFQSKGLGVSTVLPVITDVIIEIPITSPVPPRELSSEEILENMMSSERGDCSRFDNLFLDDPIVVENIIQPPKISKVKNLLFPKPVPVGIVAGQRRQPPRAAKSAT
jgi:hypothetical protein